MLEALLRDPSLSANIALERRYQGTGVYRCGKCGATMVSAAHNRSRSHGWKRTYACSTAKHLARDVEALDAYIDEVVIARLSQPDAAIVLGGPVAEDVGALHTAREGLRARLDDLSALFAAGDIDGPSAQAGQRRTARRAGQRRRPAGSRQGVVCGGEPGARR